MSRYRKRGKDVEFAYVDIVFVCPAENHTIGRVIRQRGRDMVEASLERIDGPNGETKVRAVCAACRAKDPMSLPRSPGRFGCVDHAAVVLS